MGIDHMTEATMRIRRLSRTTSTFLLVTSLLMITASGAMDDAGRDERTAECPAANESSSQLQANLDRNADRAADPLPVTG